MGRMKRASKSSRGARVKAPGGRAVSVAAPSATAAPKRPVVHVISDSTGNLAQHTLTALLTQFPSGALSVRVWPFLRDQPALLNALHAAAHEGGAVIHALVSSQAK